MAEVVPGHLVLSDLREVSSATPDLIVEVAHPSVVAEYGVLFLKTADFMVCTPHTHTHTLTHTHTHTLAHPPTPGGVTHCPGGGRSGEEGGKRGKGGRTRTLRTCWCLLGRAGHTEDG